MREHANQNLSGDAHPFTALQPPGAPVTQLSKDFVRVQIGVKTSWFAGRKILLAGNMETVIHPRSACCREASGTAGRPLCCKAGDPASEETPLGESGT